MPGEFLWPMRQKRNDKLKSSAASVGAERSLDPRGLVLAVVVGLFVVTPLIPSEATVHEGAGAALHLLWTLALLGWTGLLVLRPGTQIVFGWTGVAAAVLIGLCVTSALAVGLSGNGRQALNMLWQWISYGVGAFLLRQLLTSAVQCRALMVIMAALAVVESAAAHHEYFVTGPAQRAAFQADPEAMYRQQGLTTEPHREQFRWRIESVEPLGTFGLTNSLAGLLAPWLIVLLGIGLTVMERRPDWRPLAGVALASALIAGCLLLTKSRTAILATALGIVLLALYGRSRGWQFGWKLPALAAAALLLIGLGAVAVGGLDVQVVSEAPLSVLYRIEYWQATATMIADHPLLGVGPGNFQQHYARYALPQASEVVADPHNFLFELWATAGTPALLALLALAAAFVWQLSRGSPDLPPPASGGEDRPPDPVSAAETSRQRVWIYGGACFGLAAAYPLALLAGYPLKTIGPDASVPVIWLLGLPVAAICIWLLDPWVRQGNQGKMPTALPVIALVVLLTNLLAAGAISFPGVFGSVWLLLAVSVAHGKFPAWRWSADRHTGLIAMLAAAILAAACIRTDYSPVVISKARLDEGRALQSSGQFPQAEAEMLVAATADPWSPAPWQALADLRLQVWLRSQDPHDLDRFDEAAAGFVARNPKHHAAYETLGGWRLIVWRKGGDAGALELAIEAYRQATAWYPNKARLRAQLAWALHLAGRDGEALAEAEEALRLDRLNPHREKKLAAETLVDPQLGPFGPVVHRPENAEQTLLDLRSSIGLEKRP
jgi:O-antigen ligase